jgi:hypothetical protein
LKEKENKKPSQKKASGVAQSVGPEFKPQYCQKKIMDKDWGHDSSGRALA